MLRRPWTALWFLYPTSLPGILILDFSITHQTHSHSFSPTDRWIDDSLNWLRFPWIAQQWLPLVNKAGYRQVVSSGLDRFRKSPRQQQQPMTVSFRAQYININNEDIVISETMRDTATPEHSATRPSYIHAAILNWWAHTSHLLARASIFKAWGKFYANLADGESQPRCK